MTTLQALLAFALAAGLLTVTPGLDTALILRTGAVEGPRRAFLAAAGIGLGCLVWGAAAALGVGVLLTASRWGFAALKWAGAGYLVYLGAGMLIRPRRSFPLSSHDQGAARGWLLKGLLTNLLNPKVGVFYIAFLPQFVPASPPLPAPLFIFALAGLHVAMGLVWASVLIGALQPLTRFLRRPAVVQSLDRLTGAVLIGFGLKLALAERR